MQALLGTMILPWDEMLWRITIATAFGLILGLDRQMRRLSAGIAPHMFVALSSAVTMLIVLELYGEVSVQGRSPPDPIRVIHGLAIAVGILCSGAVFVAKDRIYGLTTAANLWTTSSLGVAVGAGMYQTAVAGFILDVLILSAVWVVTRYLPGSRSHS